MPVQVVHEHGSFDGDCDHIQMADSAWHRLGSKPHSGGGGGPSPVPNATFAKLAIAAGETVTLKVALAVGEQGERRQGGVQPITCDSKGLKNLNTLVKAL